jgi:hypothetical protein
VFERFTERARQAVVLAQDEARVLKHNYIGTEHLLLGLLREEEGVAARVLDSLDVTLVEVRAQVTRVVGEGDEVVTGQIPFTPRAKKVLELGLREALSLGHNYIGTEHVLLGLIRENEGVAARILLEFDADADKIRDQIIRMLSGASYRPPEAPSDTSEAPPPRSPPVATEVVEEIERLRTTREAAIEEQRFEEAAMLRDRERRLRRAARQFERAWAGEPELRPAPRPAPVRHVVGPPPRAAENRRTIPPLLAGWLLFGVAAGLGLLAGRLL